MRGNHPDNLSHDVIHGYIPFTAGRSSPEGETTERDLIDHPWVQRMRHIHQLQTAWWVFPTAEHTRFQHVLGAMHLASRTVASLYESLREVCPDVPSRGYVESTLRMAGLLHDVGHGPFGHFFDAFFLRDYGLTHESLGGLIIRDELGDLLRGILMGTRADLFRSIYFHRTVRAIDLTLADLFAHSKHRLFPGNLVEQRVRETLPGELSDLPMRVDIARHLHRPHTHGPAGGQNFLYDSARDRVRPLSANQLFSRLPISHRICRIYAESEVHAQALAMALDDLIGESADDDLTNM